MVNTSKMQGIMREKGHTIKSLAKAIGLSQTGLFNKIHNKREFALSELAAIIEEMCLTIDETIAIFFMHNIPKNQSV